MKQRKNIDLTDNCIETLSIEAIKQKSDFKNLAQDILEHLAINKLSLDKVLLSMSVAVRLEEKNKNK